MDTRVTTNLVRRAVERTYTPARLVVPRSARGPEERAVAELEAQIARAQTRIAQLQQELEALGDGFTPEGLRRLPRYRIASQLSPQEQKQLAASDACFAELSQLEKKISLLQDSVGEAQRSRLMASPLTADARYLLY